MAHGTGVFNLSAAQQTCTNGIRVEGIITDPTGAVIPGAQVQAYGAERIITDYNGALYVAVRSGKFNDHC
jgi:hypothetical protein